MVNLRPILFHTRSMRGILAGRKTQTRRIINDLPDDLSHITLDGEGPTASAWCECGNGAHDQVLRFPYGKPGDVLWARESFHLPDSADYLPPSKVPPHWRVFYPADESMSHHPLGESFEWWLEHHAGRKRPSIHMPKWACRVFLPVTSVRVERVQDISAEDIYAEGVHYDAEGLTPEQELLELERIWTRLWNDTNGPGAWNRNDWVWVVEWDEVLTPAEAREHVGADAWEAWVS